MWGKKGVGDQQKKDKKTVKKKSSNKKKKKKKKQRPIYTYTNPQIQITPTLLTEDTPTPIEQRRFAAPGARRSERLRHKPYYNFASQKQTPPNPPVVPHSIRSPPAKICQPKKIRRII